MWAFEQLTRHGVLSSGAQLLQLGAHGAEWFKRAGIDVLAIDSGRRVLCRACLDWSERRHHLAGALGAALLRRVDELGWAQRAKRSRVVHFTPRGERAFRQLVQAAARSQA